MARPLSLFESWAIAFAITQLVEMPIYRWLAPTSWPRAFALSLVTHPIVWFAFPLLYPTLGWTPMMWLAEAFAYLVEAAMLRAYGAPWKRALAVSVIANTASIVVGELVRAPLAMF